MTKLGWSFVDAVSQLLELDEREAVQGDLLEANESNWQSLRAVSGLVIRREASLWKNWRPWLAAFGWTLPASFLLMRVSVSVTRAFQQLIDPSLLQQAGLTPGSGLYLLACQAFLLIGWSWTGGFVVGSVSKRTVWISAALSFAPCLLCLSRFNIRNQSRLCLLLFLIPATWGVLQGMRTMRLKLGSALLIALAITALTIPTAGNGSGLSLLTWLLGWPAWYLVATSHKPARLPWKERKWRTNLL
jgi:hypothetical protein